MAGVRVTSNRLTVIEESSNIEKLRVSAIRYAVIHSILEQNPDWPTGAHTLVMTG